MSFWKRNQDEENNETNKQEEESTGINPEKGAAAMFDILREASALIDDAGGLPEDGASPMHHESGETCADADCPFRHIETPEAMRAWVTFYQTYFGDDFILGMATPDGNPIARFIKACLSPNLNLDSAKMMTSSEGVLLVITIDLQGVAVFQHPLPAWATDVIKEIIANIDIHNELTAGLTQELLSKVA